MSANNKNVWLIFVFSLSKILTSSLDDETVFFWRDIIRNGTCFDILAVCDCYSFFAS